MTSEQKAAYIMAQAALLNAKAAIIARERAEAVEHMRMYG